MQTTYNQTQALAYYNSEFGLVLLYEPDQIVPDFSGDGEPIWVNTFTGEILPRLVLA